MIPTHPESVPGDPQTLCWVVPEGVLDVDGSVSAAPGRLGEMIEAGEIAVVAGPTRLLITLAPGRTWREQGPAIRTALHAALEDPPGWAVVRIEDADIAAAAAAVIAGPAGAMVEQHGGSVRVAGVHNGRVRLEVGGACAGCPAAGLSVGTTLAAALRAAVPGITAVETVEVPRPRFVPLTAVLRGLGGGRPPGHRTSPTDQAGGP